MYLLKVYVASETSDEENKKHLYLASRQTMHK